MKEFMAFTDLNLTSVLEF